MALAPECPDTIFCAGFVYAGSSYRVQTSLSTDGGTTWAHETLPDLAVRANAAIFDPCNPSRVLIGGDLSYSSSFLRVSTDLGATWTAGEDGLYGAVNTIVGVPNRPGRFYCGTTGGCFLSTDSGLTWTQKGGVSGVQAIVVDTADAGLMYAGTRDGVFFSSDGGENWEQMGSSLPVNNVLSLALQRGSAGALLAGTNGAGAFSIEPLAGIGGQPGAGRDAYAGLLSIEPNPVSGKATIRLSARMRGTDRVTITDVAGRHVRSIPVPQSTIGTRQSDFSVTWDCRDDAGRPVQAGAYFVVAHGARSRLVLVR